MKTLEDMPADSTAMAIERRFAEGREVGPGDLDVAMVWSPQPRDQIEKSALATPTRAGDSNGVSFLDNELGQLESQFSFGIAAETNRDLSECHYRGGSRFHLLLGFGMALDFDLADTLVVGV